MNADKTKRKTFGLQWFCEPRGCKCANVFRMRSLLLIASFTASMAAKPLPKLPLSFERNAGQGPAAAAFVARADGYAVLLSGRAVTIESPEGSYEFGFAGPADEPSIEPASPLPGKSNYLIGRDPKNWITGIATYAGVRYRELYPGIDLLCHGESGRFEYDFVVSPGADPSRIRLRFKPGLTAKVDRRGDLVVTAGRGEWRQQAPRVYQGPKGILGRFAAISKNEVGFAIAPYDHSKELIIDPVLVQSTQFGGNRYNIVSAIAVDADGNAYITGSTNSDTFPTTPNSYHPQYIGGPCPVTEYMGQQLNAYCSDVFVAKLNAAGSALLYATYIGGTRNDGGSGIAVDSRGNVYVAGSTASSDFPITPGAMQSVNRGGLFSGDAFLLELDPSGSKLAEVRYG